MRQLGERTSISRLEQHMGFCEEAASLMEWGLARWFWGGSGIGVGWGRDWSGLVVGCDWGVIGGEEGGEPPPPLPHTCVHASPGAGNKSHFQLAKMHSRPHVLSLIVPCAVSEGPMCCQ